MLRFNFYLNEMLNLPPWVHCKGDVNVPDPTPEQKAASKAQTEILQKESAWMTALEPILLESFGYKANQVENPEYKAYLDRRAAWMKDRPWASEDNLTRAYETIESAPLQYTSTFSKMTDEERLGSMTEQERADYDIQRKIQQRTLDALEGNLPVSPALESSLQREQAGLETELSTKLGPNWKLSTPATTKLGEFKKRAELVREEARRGQISQGVGQNISQGNYLTGQNQATISGLASPLSMYGGILGGYGNLYQQGLGQQNLATSAAMQSQANAAAERQGWMNMIGNIAGNGAAASIMKFSSPKMKKNIKKADDDDALDMVKTANTYEYNYKGEPKGTPKQVGYMADEAPGDTGDGVMLDLGKVTGLHAAALKAMAKKIDKLEKAVKEK